MKILGLAGAKQSGKSSTANWLLSVYLKYLNVVNFSEVDAHGDLYINAEMNGQKNIIKIDPNRSEIIRSISSHVQCYSFADKLKELSIHLFGLTYEQCYGTDEQKNSLTRLKWGNFGSKIVKKYGRKNDELMTAREVVQIFGTDVLRAIDYRCHIDGLIRQMKQNDNNGKLNVICDGRFRNELDTIRENGGKVIYFTKKLQTEDKHISESLSPDNYEFDLVVDNNNINIWEKSRIVYDYLTKIEWLPFGVDFNSTLEK